MDWKRLKGRPLDRDAELTIIRVSANETEVETARGLRYLRVRDSNGADQWFTLTSNQRMKSALRGGIQVCCSRMQRAFGKFIDRGQRGTGAVSIFRKQGNGDTLCMEITHCPFCGKKLRFIARSEEQGKPRGRTAAAGARH